MKGMPTPSNLDRVELFRHDPPPHVHAASADRRDFTLKLPSTGIQKTTRSRAFGQGNRSIS